MEAYSKDIRNRVIKSIKAGSSFVETADRYQLARQTVSEYWKRYQEKGEVYRKQHGGYRRSRLDPYREEIKRWIEQDNDMTLETLQERLSERYKVNLSVSTLGYHLERMNLSYKKNATRQRARAS